MKSMPMPHFDPDIPSHVAGQCPPGDAQAADGTFYRHVPGPSWTNDDFEADYKTNKTPLRLPEKCDSWACSIFDSWRSAEAMMTRYKKFRQQGVWLEVQLQTHHGVVNQGSGHRDFWKYVGADVVSSCKVLP